MWEYTEIEPSVEFHPDKPEWLIFSIFHYGRVHLDVWNIVHNYETGRDKEYSEPCAIIYYPVSGKKCTECGAEIPEEVMLVAELIRC